MINAYPTPDLLDSQSAEQAQVLPSEKWTPIDVILNNRVDAANRAAAEKQDFQNTLAQSNIDTTKAFDPDIPELNNQKNALQALVQKGFLDEGRDPSTNPQSKYFKEVNILKNNLLGGAGQSRQHQALYTALNNHIDANPQKYDVEATHHLMELWKQLPYAQRSKTPPPMPVESPYDFDKNLKTFNDGYLKDKPSSTSYEDVKGQRIYTTTKGYTPSQKILITQGLRAHNPNFDKLYTKKWNDLTPEQQEVYNDAAKNQPDILQEDGTPYQKSGLDLYASNFNPALVGEQTTEKGTNLPQPKLPTKTSSMLEYNRQAGFGNTTLTGLDAALERIKEATALRKGYSNSYTPNVVPDIPEGAFNPYTPVDPNELTSSSFSNEPIGKRISSNMGNSKEVDNIYHGAKYNKKNDKFFTKSEGTKDYVEEKNPLSLMEQRKSMRSADKEADDYLLNLYGIAGKDGIPDYDKAAQIFKGQAAPAATPTKVEGKKPKPY